ncbi:MAG: hypothetical protein AB7G21_00985 [Dehalococcoidia bacterium]
MNRTQSIRATFLYSLVGTVLWLGLLVYWGEYTPTNALVIGPLIFLMFFSTMLATNRLSAALARRVEARRKANEPPRGPAVVAPTSDRVEHNQRRRERQRTERRRR